MVLVFTTLLKASLSIFYKQFGNFDIFSRRAVSELKGVISVILKDVNIFVVFMLGLMIYGLWRIVKGRFLP